MEPTSNTWLRVNQEMLGNTTLGAWGRLYTGAGSALMPPVPNREVRVVQWIWQD